MVWKQWRNSEETWQTWIAEGCKQLQRTVWLITTWTVMMFQLECGEWPGRVKHTLLAMPVVLWPLLKSLWFPVRVAAFHEQLESSFLSQGKKEFDKPPFLSLTWVKLDFTWQRSRWWGFSEPWFRLISDIKQILKRRLTHGRASRCL